MGVSPPVFAGAARRRGVYSTSGTGSVWIGSPVAEIASALVRGMAGRAELRWGAARFTVRGVELETRPDPGSGYAEFATVSPVLVKLDSQFLLPDDAGYADRLVHNIRHKADVLGLPGEAEVEVVGAGPRRGFEVGNARQIGATARLRLKAEPVLLDALYDWGLGLATIQGFGWVR